MSYKDPAQQNAYQSGYNAGRRRAWLEANGPCVQCGSNEQLEVDHIDPSQRVTHRVWSLAQEKREAELAKCQVLCRACHKAKTAEARRVPLVHGTLSGYQHHGCRCEPCRQQNLARQRRHRERWSIDRRRAERTT